MGFAICAFIPASMQSLISSWNAFAVIAMMGISFVSLRFNINHNTLLIIPGTLHFVPPRLYSPHYWYTHTIPYSDRFCDMYIFYNCPQSKALEQLLIERGPTRDGILTWVKNKVKINCVKRGRYKFSSQIVKWFLYLGCDMIHKNTKSP